MHADKQKVSKDRVKSALLSLEDHGWEIAADSTEEHSPRVLLPASFENAFNASGELVRDLAFGWEAAEGTPAHLQTAFAGEGLVVRISFNEAGDDEESERDAGTAVCLAARAGDSDLCRIEEAFVRLRSLGYTAEGAFAWTSSMGWGDISPGDDGEIRAVFWNTQCHDAFGTEGDLVDDLNLQWAGDPQVIATELARTGLVVITPESTYGTFTLRPPLIRYDLKPDVARTDVHDTAWELGWISVEISADDGRFYEEVWTTDDEQNTIRYIEDPSASAAHFIVTGNNTVEVTDDIASVFEI